MNFQKRLLQIKAKPKSFLLFKFALAFTCWLLFEALLALFDVSLGAIMIEHLSTQVYKILLWIGVDSNPYLLDFNNFSNAFLFENGQAMSINESCDGLKILGIFLLILFVFPGPYKIPFAALGVLLIHGANVFRIVFLSHVLASTPSYFDTLHKVAFPIMLYAFVIILWWIYLKLFSFQKEQVDEK